MTEVLKHAIWRYANQHANAEGFVATPIQGVGMMRAYAPTGLMRAMYRPLLCLVLQGAKQVTTQGRVHAFGAGQSLIVGVDLPVVGHVVRASAAEPYLALALDLDMAIMREVMGQVATTGEPPRPHGGSLFVEDTAEAVTDCALRLVRLLDRPEAIPVLRPAIVKEMHYWLLAGRHNAAIRRLALPDSHAERVAHAVAILRAEFARPVPVGRLAAAAGMSPSSFHQHFKAVTSLSPPAVPEAASPAGSAAADAGRRARRQPGRVRRGVRERFAVHQGVRPHVRSLAATRCRCKPGCCLR